MQNVGLSNNQVTVSVITGGHFFSHFYLLTLPPIFPMLRAEFGLSNAQLGLLISVISLAMVLQLPVGEVVDRIGAKVVFTIGLVVTSAGIVLTGTSSSYLWLLTFTIVSGLGQSTFHPAGYPLIESASTPARQGRNFSIHTFGGYVGSATAPLIVGAIAVIIHWQIALIAVGLLGLAYAIVVWFTIEPIYHGSATQSTEDTDSSPSVGSLDALLRPGILVMFLFFFVITMANKGVQSFTPLLAIDAFALTEGVGNVALSAFFATTALGVLAGGVLADRYDPRRVIAASLGISTLGIWFLVAGPLTITATLMVAITGAVGIFYGLIYPSRDKLVSMLSADGSTGRSFGFVFTGTSIGGFLSPVFLGVVIDISTIIIAFQLVALFFLLSGIVALLVGSRFIGAKEWASVTAK